MILRIATRVRSRQQLKALTAPARNVYEAQAGIAYTRTISVIVYIYVYVPQPCSRIYTKIKRLKKEFGQASGD